MNKKWNLYNISETRSILMGFATIIVAFFHCYSYHFEKIIPNSLIANLLNFLRLRGNVGVDIFLFISAIGLYFSFTKDSNIKYFYKKRISRILPSILIVAIIYYLIEKVNFITFIKGITLTSLYFDGDRTFWYFSLIIILYMLYPLFHKIINKKNLLGLLELLLLTIIPTILLMKYNYLLYQKIEIAITRIPIFLLGIYIGKNIYLKKEIPAYYILIFTFLFILCNILLYLININPYIIVRYIYGIIGLSLVFIISYLHTFIKINICDNFLIFIGKYSMEIYLIFEKLCLYIKKIKILPINNNFIFYLIMFIITIILSYILKIICNIIINKKNT